MEKRDPKLEQQLLQALNGARIGKPCYAFREVSSTMDVAQRLASESAPEGACVWAERQVSGRGREGRLWVSPQGGIYCSLILRPTRSVGELPQLALVTGLATVEAIQQLTGLSAAIRWPNDVLVAGKKVAGILAEASTQPTAGRTQISVVVGIGINVTTEPSDLPEGAASLAQWAKPVPDRVVFAGALFRQFERVYQQWTDEGFTAIRPALIRWSGLFGKLVHIRTPSGRFDGQATDLDEAGRLLVRLDSGLVRAFDVGDVTLLR